MNTVPTLDIQALHDQERRSELLAQVRAAYSELGFCCFTGHGVGQDVRDRARVAFERLFALPEVSKMKYHLPALAGKRGYTPLGTEKALGGARVDLKEFWHVGRSGVDPLSPQGRYMARNIWPLEVPGFREATIELYQAMERFGMQVLEVMGLAIGLAPALLPNACRNGNSILRGLHYPPLRGAKDSGSMRAAPHEDISMITLLVGSRQAGLELLTLEGEWIAVQPEGDAIIVNVGDMLQRLTNHVYRSTTHRVINPVGEAATKARYSMPFFMDPAPDFLIRTLPECINESNPDQYPDPILANDFLIERLRAIGVSK